MLTVTVQQPPATGGVEEHVPVAESQTLPASPGRPPAWLQSFAVAHMKKPYCTKAQQPKPSGSVVVVVVDGSDEVVVLVEAVRC